MIEILPKGLQKVDVSQKVAWNYSNTTDPMNGKAKAANNSTINSYS
jgi:hypothetical protein